MRDEIVKLRLIETWQELVQELGAMLSLGGDADSRFDGLVRTDLLSLTFSCNECTGSLMSRR